MRSGKLLAGKDHTKDARHPSNMDDITSALLYLYMEHDIPRPEFDKAGHWSAGSQLVCDSMGTVRDDKSGYFKRESWAMLYNSRAASRSWHRTQS